MSTEALGVIITIATVIGGIWLINYLKPVNRALRELRAKDWRIRFNGLQALIISNVDPGSDKLYQNEEVLLKLLEDQNDEVREASAKVLKKIGYDGSKKMVEALIVKLDDESEKVRKASKETLESLVKKTTKELEEASTVSLGILTKLQNKDESVRKKVVEELGKLILRAQAHRVYKAISPYMEELEKIKSAEKTIGSSSNILEAEKLLREAEKQIQEVDQKLQEAKKKKDKSLVDEAEKTSQEFQQILRKSDETSEELQRVLQEIEQLEIEQLEEVKKKKHEDWEIVMGDEATRQAQQLNIIKSSESYPVARLTPRVKPKGGVIVKGSATCHGCSTNVPFEYKFDWDLYGCGFTFTCPSCGNQLSIERDSETVKGVKTLFFYIKPWTQQRGQQNRPIKMTIHDIRG